MLLTRGCLAAARCSYYFQIDIRPPRVDHDNLYKLDVSTAMDKLVISDGNFLTTTVLVEHLNVFYSQLFWYSIWAVK